MSEPHDVFRWLRREDRAAYASAMHETLAGKMRDLDRAAARLGMAATEGVRADLRSLRERMRWLGL